MGGCGPCQSPSCILLALISLSPSGSFFSSIRLRPQRPKWAGNEPHVHRSSAGLRAHTGACWEPWLPWEHRVTLYFPSVCLYCNIHKMSVSTMSCRRTLSQAVVTGYMFKQGSYLPICLVDFQPLIHHTGMLHKQCYTIPIVTGIWGQGERQEKTRNVFKSLM